MTTYINLQARGQAKPSFLRHHLEALNREGSKDTATIDDVKSAAATLYIGGAETVRDFAYSSLCLLIMLELEYAVYLPVGNDTPPGMSDRSSERD